MKTVAEILRSKADPQIFSIAPTDTVFEAISRMSEQGVGALVVLDEGRLVGIVSERDYARKMILRGRSSVTTPVSEIMTRNVITVEPRETSQKCMELMTDGHLRHLPVVEQGELLGLVSIGDLVKGIIAEQQDLIQHLEQYIRGE